MTCADSTTQRYLITILDVVFAVETCIQQLVLVFGNRLRITSKQKYHIGDHLVLDINSSRIISSETNCLCPKFYVVTVFM